MTIITTAIASTSKPAAPVSEAAVARSGLTRAVIFRYPFLQPLLLLTYNASLESDRYEIVTGRVLWSTFLSVGDGQQWRFAVQR
jgi:hypothetical protein